MRSRIPAALALAATLAATSSAQAFEVKHAAGGELVRWRRAGVAWTIDRSVKEVPGGEDAVSAAIAAWTQKAGAPRLSLAKKGAHLTPGLDGTNAVFYAKDGYAPAGVALAVTVLSFDDQSGEVLDADIVINGKYEIGAIDVALPAPAAEDDCGAETYDVGRIVAHEMGHALALSDELELKDALMYPYVPRAQVLRAKPGTDDLAGLETLYAPETPTPASAEASKAGCAGAVVARSGPRSAPGGAWCALGLALAALVIARRPRRGAKAAAGCTVLAAVVMVMPARGEDAPLTTTTATTGESERESVVTDVSTTMTDGIFRSEVVAVTDRGTVSRHVIWGGTLGGIRQIVGGTPVPVRGDKVRIVVPSRASGVGVLRLVSRRAE